jgi:hypothetical protein
MSPQRTIRAIETHLGCNNLMEKNYSRVATG